MRPKTKHELDTILDCMAGADGGVAFVRLREAIERWDQEAVDGNPASAEVIAIMSRFARLIDICNKGAA
jgi:hypothetical protein